MAGIDEIDKVRRERIERRPARAAIRRNVRQDCDLRERPGHITDIVGNELYIANE